MYIFVFTDVHFDLYAAGLVHHTQYHRILPTGRHLNFALHFKTFTNFWLNLKTLVRVLVLKSKTDTETLTLHI